MSAFHTDAYHGALCKSATVPNWIAPEQCERVTPSESSERRQEWLGDLTAAEQQWAEDYRIRSGGREHIIEAAILTDRMLEKLRELPNLHVLRLVNTSTSGRGVEAIAVHAGLEELDLSVADFTLETARAVARLTLLRKFRYADVTDESLAAFAGLTHLEELELWATGVTDAGIRHLLPLQSLRKLALRGSSITDSRLLDLATLPHLERLDISYAKGGLTQEGLTEFQRRRPQCQLITDGLEFAAAEVDGQPGVSPRGARGPADGAGPGGSFCGAAATLMSDADGMVEVTVPEGTRVRLQHATADPPATGTVPETGKVP